MSAHKKKDAGINQIEPGRFRVTARVRVSGKIIQRREVIEGTKEKARDRRAEMKREIRKGLPACSLTNKAEFRTFSDVLQIHKEKKGPFSRKHEYKINMLEKEMGAAMLEGFADRFEGYVRILKTTKTKQGKLRSAASINRPVEIARAAFETAFALGIVKDNPITKVRFPKMKEIPRDVSLSVDERDRLVNIARENPRTAHIADLLDYALQVPCRKSELVNMRVKDIDLFNNAIRVRNGTTKNDQGTYKPIPPSMRSWFQERVRKAKAIDEPIFGRMIKGSRADRTGEHTHMAGLGDFKNAWDTVRAAARLPEIRIHDTRHYSATVLCDNGTPEQVVMTVAGWKTNMLRTYYCRQPKKALELVRFSPKCETDVKTSEPGIREIC